MSRYITPYNPKFEDAKEYYEDFLADQQRDELLREYENHDCHASPEDGCSACELFRAYIGEKK